MLHAPGPIGWLPQTVPYGKPSGPNLIFQQITLQHFVLNWIYFTPFHHFLFFVFVTPLSPKTVKIVSGIETQSRSYRFVLNLWTSPLRFPYWCHCELHLPRLVGALPRLLFRHCLPLLLFKTSKLVVGHANSQPGNESSTCVNSKPVGYLKARWYHI